MAERDDIAIAVSKVTPVPGDVVVLRLVGTTYMTAEHAQQLVADLRATLPDGVRGIVLGAGELASFGDLLDRAEAAVVEAHEREARAYLNGDVPANQWRPRIYAEAALRAAFDGVERDGTAVSGGER